MQGIIIEKNVPLPPDMDPVKRAAKQYDWTKVEIGDSFVVTGSKERMKVRTSFIQHQRSRKNRFPPKTVLVSRDIGDGQYRFWLLKNP